MRKILMWATLILITFAGFYSALRYGINFLKWVNISLSDAKTLSEILLAFVQIMAIIVAGVWTYQRFIKNREDYPYPKIQYRIEHYYLRNGKIYLSVFVTVTNEGKTKLDLGGGKIFIRQVFPIPKEIKGPLQEPINDYMRLGKTPGLFVDSGQRIGWVTVGSREWSDLREHIKELELEPGQTREIQFDFLIEDSIEVIETISWIKYPNSSWESTVIYSLTEGKISKQSTG